MSYFLQKGKVFLQCCKLYQNTNMFVQLQSIQSPARANLQSAMTVFFFFLLLLTLHLHNGIMGSAMLCL